MWVYIWNKLPSEYQEVEYIQSDTSNIQYINTWYLPTSNPKIELDFMYINWVETTDYVWFDIYWRRWSTNSTYIWMYINNPNWYVSPNYAGFDPGQNSWVTISKNTRYYHIQDGWQFYLNWTKYANASTTNTLATANYPIFLFWNNIQWTVQGRKKSMRVYSCKMWNDWTLVRDFIPCYRKSDNVIGLYDLVNNQFYTNSWSGTFSKWSDVNTYRESSLKNAYIGEYEFATKYQEVEWIGWYNNSAWFEEYIDTWVTAWDTIWIHTSMLHTATRDNAEWFYTNPWWNTNRRWLTTYPSWCWCPQRQSWHQTNVWYSINTWYDIKLNYENNKQTLIDGTNIYSLWSWTITSTVTVKVGNISYSWYWWECKFIKITNWTTLVRDMIPCYRKSDNVIWMYDTINKQFYTNAGTWTFTKWPDVN